MENRRQTQEDYVGVSPIQNNNALELFPFDYNDRDNPFHFPFSGPQISPSPAENLCGYQQNFPSGVACEDLMTNVNQHNNYPFNNPVNQDIALRNNIPMLDNQSFSFRSVGADTISSVPQNFTNNMMGVYRGMNRAPYLENHHGSVIRNSFSASSSGIESRPKFEQTTLPRAYDNQVGVHSSRPYSEDKLDGRFLSLGYQGQVPSYMNSHGGKATHHIGDSFISSHPSQQGQISDSSFNNVRGGPGVFEINVDSATTRWDSTGSNYGLQSMTLGFDINPIAKIDEGEVNMRHYIPTPNTISSESGKNPNSIIDLTGPSECYGPNSMLPNVPRYDDVPSRSKKRRIQRASFNSSVLRSNHQIASQVQHNSHLSTDLLLPSSGSNIGESDIQGKQGQIYPPPFPVHGQPSTVQGSDFIPNNKLHCDSSFKSESLKCTLNLPPRDTNQNQCRKLTPQTPVRQFSPNLLQNALGQIPIGHSTPDITSSKGFNIPNPIKDFAPIGWPRLPSCPFSEGSTPTSNSTTPQNPIASIPPFPPPSSQDYPVPRRDSSTIPVIWVDSPPRVSQPLNPPPVALERTIDSRRGLSNSQSQSQIPVASTKRVMTANSLGVPNRPSSGIALQRPKFQPTASTMNRAVRTEWKKSLPTMAGLAKMDPALRASQVLASMPRIKWQGFEIAPTVGYKCMICKRDLSFTSDGPVLQPAIPPAVAVLPCGHTFHDECLTRITPHDQSKDPPCIPCAVDN